MIAPDFVYAETASTLRKYVYRGILPAEDGAIGLGLIKRLDIKRYDVRDLYYDAWRIAGRFNLGSLYDAFYLALSELRACDFWTADEKLLRSVAGLPYTNSIRGFTSGALAD